MTIAVPAHLRVLRRSSVQPDGCLTFDGPLSPSGYGRVNVARGRSRPAHRVVYEALVAEVPRELVMDHLCRNRACVNPHHLEPVTPRENTLRGINRAAMNKRKTHCKRGHDLNGPDAYVNPKGERTCKLCRLVRLRLQKATVCVCCGEYGTIPSPTRVYLVDGQDVRLHPACRK